MEAKRKPNILVVEPSATQASLINHQIGEHFTIVRVNGVREAIETLRNGNTFNLITTALMMPNGSGFELIAFIRNLEQHKNTHIKNMPILCISAVLDDKVCQDLEKAGCSEYIAKPYNANDLLNAINRLLNK